MADQPQSDEFAVDEKRQLPIQRSGSASLWRFVWGIRTMSFNDFEWVRRGSRFDWVSLYLGSKRYLHLKYMWIYVSKNLHFKRCRWCRTWQGSSFRYENPAVAKNILTNSSQAFRTQCSIDVISSFAGETIWSTSVVSIWQHCFRNLSNG